MDPVDNLVALISTALRSNGQVETEAGWLLGTDRGGKFDLLERRSVEGHLDRLSKAHFASPVAITTDTEHEVLIIDDSVFGSRSVFRHILRDESLILEDSDNRLRYELGTVSTDLACAILINLQENLPRREFNQRLARNFIVPRTAYERENLDPWHALSMIFRRYSSLKITSESRRTKEKFNNLVDSAIFHFAYNLDIPFVTVPTTVALFAGRVNRRSKRMDYRDMEPPRLVYHSDLVHRYVAALSSEDIISKFLGYYHIAEHYFETLFNQFLVTQVRGQLTAPGFSLRRDADVQSLIKSVSRLIRERQNETSSFDEQKALLLTLEAFVQLPRFRDSLEATDPALVDYYAGSEVQFSRGDRVDLQAHEDLVLPALARRIYKTRNSVVHARTGEKGRYRPHLDDEALLKELPLMRAVAEEILISTANLLE